MKYQIEHESIKQYQPDIEKIQKDEIVNTVDNSIEYINIYNTLEIIDNPNDFLTMLLTKLRLKGSVAIIGIDLNKLCELYLNKIFDFTEFNDLIKNKFIFPLSDTINLLKNNNYKINLIKTDKLLYYIECGRIINDQN